MKLFTSRGVVRLICFQVIILQSYLILSYPILPSSSYLSSFLPSFLPLLTFLPSFLPSFLPICATSSWMIADNDMNWRAHITDNDVYNCTDSILILHNFIWNIIGNFLYILSTIVWNIRRNQDRGSDSRRYGSRSIFAFINKTVFLFTFLPVNKDEFFIYLFFILFYFVLFFLF